MQIRTIGKIGAFVVGLTLVALFALALQIARPSTAPMKESCVGTPQRVMLGDHTLSIEIADTPETLRQGLSDRPRMARDHGMLFVFSDLDVRTFWMKGMEFPLDIIWIGPTRRVIGVAANALPSDFPKTYVSPAPVAYVLEVNAGVADALRIATDTEVRFSDCTQ